MTAATAVEASGALIASAQKMVGALKGVAEIMLRRDHGLHFFALALTNRDPATGERLAQPRQVMIPAPAMVDENNDAHKEAFAAVLRHLLRAAEATVVIFVTDSWIKEFKGEEAKAMKADDYEHVKRAGAYADRQEAIAVMIDLADGRSYDTWAVYTRDAKGHVAGVGPWKDIDWAGGSQTGGRFGGLLSGNEKAKA